MSCKLETAKSPKQMNTIQKVPTTQNVSTGPNQIEPEISRKTEQIIEKL